MRLEVYLEPAGAAGLAGLTLRAIGGAGAGPKPPLHLALVIDVSRSMSGTKLVRVQEAAQALIRRLRPEDRVALVSFSGEARVERPQGPVGRDSAPLLARVAQLRTGAGTNLQAGWVEGVREALAQPELPGPRRVLLLTDGEVTRGTRDPAALRDMTRRGYSQGVSTSTIGVGLEFAEDVLAGIAAEGGGCFHYVDGPDTLPAVFRSELDDVVEVVARNAVLQVAGGPGVLQLRQLTAFAEARHDERSVEVRLGDLHADAYRLVGFELLVDPRLAAGSPRLVSAVLGWVDVAGGPPGQVRTELAPGARGDAPEGPLDLALVRLQAARARALERADRGDFSAALSELGQARAAARAGPAAADPRLREAIQELELLDAGLQGGPPAYSEGTSLRKEAFEVSARERSSLPLPRPAERTERRDPGSQP